MVVYYHGGCPHHSGYGVDHAEVRQSMVTSVGASSRAVTRHLLDRSGCLGELFPFGLLFLKVSG